MQHFWPGSYYTTWRPNLDSRLPETTRYSVIELKKLFTILSGRKPKSRENWWARMAPSIITRGECEMLGLSDPRFSYRVVMTTEDDWLGFVNLRRLRRVADQVRKSGIVTDHHRASSIADSLLRLPARFSQDDWHIAAPPCELVEHYGEDIPARAQSDAPVIVPYMKHLHIVGGGLCAQACCFMASLTAYRWIKQVVSLPEISFLARYTGGTSLNLSGLNLQEIITFFQNPSIQLNASIQTDTWDCGAHLVDTDWDDFLSAIKAYLNAGCPILVPVDVDRMSGRTTEQCGVQAVNVYADNYDNIWGMRFESKPTEEPANKRHMVMVLGYQRNGSNLIFHDPLVGPFMKMHVSACFQNACYVVPRTEKIVWGEFLDNATIIPVTPPQVKLGLLNSSHSENLDSDPQESRGLIHIRHLFQHEIYFPHIVGERFNFEKDWKLSLCQLQDISSSAFSLIEKCTANRVVITSVQNHAKRLVDCGCPPDRWIWLQIDGRFIFFWDAEYDRQSRPVDSDGVEAILSVGQYVGATVEWKIFYRRDDGADNGLERFVIKEQAETQADRDTDDVSAALITSYRGSLREAVTRKSTRRYDIDLYAFMRADSPEVLGQMSLIRDFGFGAAMKQIGSDCYHFFRNYPNYFPVRLDRNRGFPFYINKIPFEPIIFTSSTVCSHLASHFSDEKFIDETASRIRGLIHDPDKLVAVSTFFPEITSDNEILREQAANALICVIAIVKRLNQEPETAIQVVEMVCGGRIGDRKLRRIQSSPRLEFADDLFEFLEASVLTKEDCWKRVSECLTAIESYAKGHVRIALELEPGPLFALSDWKDLEWFSENIIKSGMCEFVGLNCDFAHWAMAGIAPETIRASLHSEFGPGKLILHSHASDFGKGHFGDLYPTAVHSRDFFYQWVQVIAEAYRERGKPTQEWGNFISLELELTANAGFVHRAMAEMRRIGIKH